MKITKEVYMIHMIDGSRQALKVPLLIFKDIFIRQRLIALSENSDRCYLHYECKYHIFLDTIYTKCKWQWVQFTPSENISIF